MADALRAFGRVPGFRERVTIALVETSPSLRATQRADVAIRPAPLLWCEDIAELPRGPLIVIANEFLDALPVRQFVRAGAAWRERCVTLDDGGALQLLLRQTARRRRCRKRSTPRDGRRRDRRNRARPRRLCSAARRAGAATRRSPRCSSITAMRESGCGDTLQAVRRHRFADPLAAPGEADLTAHVDFAALNATAHGSGLPPMDPMPQGEFLLKLGLAPRRGCLRNAPRRRRRTAIAVRRGRGSPIRGKWAFCSRSLALQSSGLASPPPFGDI